ncbi:MAG: biotin carboxylase N-terminal domain-containing protein, partial [Pseudomonadota bacterium]
MSFDTILIANRGEIACRIIRTARDMGLRTVAVYSEADASAPHVRAADDAVPIGPAPVGESYLRGERIIEAAQASGAGAIHPGYGFLSENAAFAEAVAAAGLTFIGPTPHAIRVMGDKAGAKRAMAAAGVPCAPGYQGEDQSDARLIQAAEEIGFPVRVTAAAGGGGRGMRLVGDRAALPEALAAARAEAASAFGADRLIIEAAIRRPRHVEVQVFADAAGATVHLGEREVVVALLVDEVGIALAELLVQAGDVAFEGARRRG